MELAKVERMSTEAYLESEKYSDSKREFHGGIVTVMAGASKAHEEISGNLFAALHQHLRGGSCRVYKSDMKVRIDFNREDIFLYPDVMVSCSEASASEFYIEKPKVIVEVLSGNEHRDRFEKFAIYQQIEDLEDYVVISQDRDLPEVTVCSRSEGWRKTTTTEEIFSFGSIEFLMRVSDLYE